MPTQPYVPPTRCPACGGATIRTIQTRNQARGIARVHVCKSMLNRCGDIEECGHKFDSLQKPEEATVPTVELLLSKLIEGPKPSDGTESQVRARLHREGIKTFADVVKYVKRHTKE